MDLILNYVPYNENNMLRLTTGMQLNDVVMNSYIELIQLYALPTVHIHDTYFLSSLPSFLLDEPGFTTPMWSYKSVVCCPIFMRMERFIFPVQINEVHWAVICVDFRQKTVTYLDSLYTVAAQTKTFRMAHEYLRALALFDRHTAFNVDDWSFEGASSHVSHFSVIIFIVLIVYLNSLPSRMVELTVGSLHLQTSALVPAFNLGKSFSHGKFRMLGWNSQSICCITKLTIQLDNKCRFAMGLLWLHSPHPLSAKILLM